MASHNIVAAKAHMKKVASRYNVVGIKPATQPRSVHFPLYRYWLSTTYQVER